MDLECSSNLEGGDVEILPERQAEHVQVLTAISKRTGQRDEDYREEEEEENEYIRNVISFGRSLF